MATRKRRRRTRRKKSTLARVSMLGPLGSIRRGAARLDSAITRRIPRL